MTDNNITRKLYNPKEVREMLQIGEVAYYHLLKDGVLESIQLVPRGKHKFTEKQINDCITRMQEKSS
jgi:predicted site-specific integrase-resolvase